MLAPGERSHERRAEDCRRRARESASRSLPSLALSEYKKFLSLLPNEVSFPP